MERPRIKATEREKKTLCGENERRRLFQAYCSKDSHTEKRRFKGMKERGEPSSTLNHTPCKKSTKKNLTGGGGEKEATTQRFPEGRGYDRTWGLEGSPV